MGSVALGARVLLALVFTAAAVGKLADQPGTRAALQNFRVPQSALIPLALALPLAEFLTAAALLVESSARWGAGAALALLGVFAIGIGAAMVRGEAPNCHCFGQLHSAPAGANTLFRNALLAAPAVFVLAYGPGTALDSWLPSRSSADVLALVAAVAAVALAALSVQLYLRSKGLGRDLKRVRDATATFPLGLPIGVSAPRFALPDLDGKLVTLDELLAPGRPVAMVFISPRCGPCKLLFPRLARWQRTVAHRLTIVIVGSATPRELRALSQAYGLQSLLADPESEVLEAYRALETPSALIVTPGGKVGTAMQSTAVVVEALVRQALAGLDDWTPAAQDSSATAGDDGRLELVQVMPSRG